MLIPVRLLQLRSGHPDQRIGGHSATRLIQRRARVFVGLQLRERQPELHVLGHLLHRAFEQQNGALLLLQPHSAFPQHHRVRNELQRLPVDAPLRVDVLFQIGRRQPDLHGARQVLRRVGDDDLRVLAVIEVHRLQPHAFRLRTVLATLLDQLSRGR